MVFIELGISQIFMLHHGKESFSINVQQKYTVYFLNPEAATQWQEVCYAHIYLQKLWMWPSNSPTAHQIFRSYVWLKLIQ